MATFSRYAIWAEDVRFLIHCAIKEMETGNEEVAKNKLTLALNAMDAFVDIMAMFDAQLGRMGFKRPEQIIESYKDFEISYKKKDGK